MRHKLCRSFPPWCPGVKTRCLFVFVTRLYLLWFRIEAIGQEDNDNMAKWINSNSHDLATEKYFPKGHGQMWLWKLNGTNQLMHCGRGFSAQVLRVLPFDKITQIIYIIYLPVGTCTCYPPFQINRTWWKLFIMIFFLHLFHSIVSQHYRFHVENKAGHLNTFLLSFQIGIIRPQWVN